MAVKLVLAQASLMVGGAATVSIILLCQLLGLL